MKIKILPYEQAKKEEIIARGKDASNTPYCYGIFKGWSFWGQVVEADEYVKGTKWCRVNSYYIPPWMYEKVSAKEKINSLYKRFKTYLISKLPRRKD